MSKLRYNNALVEVERRHRIKVAVVAYAYEIMSDPIMSDSEFDKLCLRINLSIDTGHRIMDTWFIENFSPHTGSWIGDHPELDKLHRIYLFYLSKRKDYEKKVLEKRI